MTVKKALLSPKRFRMILAGLGLTQTRAAEVLGRSRHAIWQYCNGVRPTPLTVAVALDGLVLRAELEGENEESDEDCAMCAQAERDLEEAVRACFSTRLAK